MKFQVILERKEIYSYTTYINAENLEAAQEIADTMIEMVMDDHYKFVDNDYDHIINPLTDEEYENLCKYVGYTL